MKYPPISVIIPAAGAGRRFQKEGPKRFQPKIYALLAKEPLIARVIRVFEDLPFVKELIIAVARGAEKQFRREVLSTGRFRKPVILVRGGRSRAESVWNGLKCVSKQCAYVCVHDAVRPLVQKDWITQLVKHRNGWDGLVFGRLMIPTVKEMREGTHEIERTLDRSKLFEAQTPQLFKKAALLKAYRLLGKRAFEATDDSSLIEVIGGRVRAFPHSMPNLKVTTYQDLRIASALIEGEQPDSKRTFLRFGLGFDRHRLVLGRPFYLGGVRIPSAVGPLGHSDGDALLHAVTDGILGAIAGGDIGDYFPDTSLKWRNVRSSRFLKKAIRLASQKGMIPAQVDATVFLERPRLGAAKVKIRAHLAKLLSLPLENVSLKAKTAEGLGPEGSGLAVSCQALVTVQTSR